MTEVTLAQVLDARENRARIQNKYLKTGHTVLSFCMNIPGPVKTSALIIRTFELGVSLITKAFEDNKIQIIERTDISEVTGPELICSISCSAKVAKEICVKIEDSCPAGRLFDMDIIDTDGTKLERESERSCLVCGKSGRYCASRRIHTVKELQDAVRKIMEETFCEYDGELISSLASSALEKEVRTTPKPGLVDLNNTGSHKDMDLSAFEKSIAALSSYWKDCFTAGFKNKGENCFSLIRERGKKAEKDMLEATGGVNTHKGAIFLLGTLCCACGRLWKDGKLCTDPVLLSEECSMLYRQSSVADFNSIREKKGPLTKGEEFFLKYGLKGARGELESGFESVLNTSLPMYEKALSLSYSENDAAVYSLLSLIGLGKDTNMVSRGGKEKADNYSALVQNMISDETYPSMEAVEEMDRLFIEQNLSPGGSADLLAVTLFLHQTAKINIYSFPI
ncbi:MAG: citrate lyase holo-[acyl-carrier protein] synthase [Sphaerochaetaceae bacterium]|nr:citrate lyase holo-[acyl-carrier protein] synthase [Sphaerochaetaceae bacterium]